MVLHRITTAGGSPVDTAVTDPEGRFTFPLTPADGRGGTGGDRPVYLATARHDGVLYFGPAVHGGDVPAGYRVVVYPSSTASGGDALGLASRTLVTVPADGGLRVMDVVVARGRPGRTTVPSDSAGQGWTVAVPPSARDLRVLPGAVDPAQVAFGPGRARISAVVPPSGQRVALGYRVPAGSPLELTLRHPVGRLEVVTRGAGGRVRVEGAGEAEPLRAGGERVERYRLRDQPAGRTVRVELRDGSGPAAGIAGWVAVGLGVVLLAAAAWTWRRRGPASARPERAARDEAGGGAA